MKSWNVNWEIKQFEIIFDEEILTFTCVNCDPKILHEFIGGYIFVSLRSIQDKSENIEDSMFFKLTERR
jgi:kindlin 2